RRSSTCPLGGSRSTSGRRLASTPLADFYSGWSPMPPVRLLVHEKLLKHCRSGRSPARHCVCLPSDKAFDTKGGGDDDQPVGAKGEVYAAGVANAREMALGDKGTVFVGSRLIDKVHAIVDKDGKRTVKVLASGLYRPNGVAFKNGTLYIAELSKVSRIDNVEDVLDDSPKPTVIYDNLPKDEAHGWKFIAIGPDNKLYVPVGQPGNNVLHDDAHGQIRRINLDG